MSKIPTSKVIQIIKDNYSSEWGFVNFIINELKINGELGTNKAKNGVDLGKHIKDADDFYSININCNRINEYLEGLDQFSIKNIRKKILNSDGKKKPIFLKEKDKIIRFSDAFFTKLTYENYKGIVTKKVHSFKIYVPKLIFKPIIENKFIGDGFFQLPARFEPLTRMCHEDLKNKLEHLRASKNDN